jgi:hypothetical protein
VTDPLRPKNGAANLGSAGLGRTRPTGNERWELATVLAYNSGTHTAVIRTEKGRPLQDVPQMRHTQGSFDHLQTGTQVVISWDLGFPVIVGILDLVGPAQTAIPAPTLTGVSGVGQDDPTQPTEGTNNYRPPHAPTDMGGGDWAQVGTLGNHVAVLEGGLSLLGAPSAQVQSFAAQGILRHVARVMENISDFGLWRMENKQGRTSFVLRAGANQTTQTGLDEQHYAIQFDLGATGDILDFKITEPEGKVLFRLHAGADGRVQIYGDGGVDISSGAGGLAEQRHDIAGARTTSVGGNETHAVQGGHAHTVDGDHALTVGGDHAHSTAGNATQFVGGDHAHGVGGDQTSVVAGKRTTSVGDDDKHDIDGDWNVSATGSLDLKARSGATLETSGQAKVNGAQIILGGSGMHPIPKFDLFLIDLAAFLGSLTTAIGALVPSNPFALAPAMVQIGLFAAKVASQLSYISTKVRND